LTVFVWGFTAILGQLISKSALILVWYRLLIACIALFLYLILRNTKFRVPPKTLSKYIAIGILVVVHWVFFYESIKVSKISVCLIALSSITLFTGILDPLFNRRKLLWLDILTGVLIMSGILLIFKFESRYYLGTIYGLIAAFLASLFTIFNSQELKKLVIKNVSRKNETILISFYELSGGFLFLTIYLFYNHQLNTKTLSLIPSDLVYLLLLGIICTAIAYVVGFAVMKSLSPFTVNLITSLEPVYGIILAFLIFGKSEALNMGFYVGAFMILGSIILYPFLKNKLDKEILIS
jgi:drug/metabolite transporter (DMT)-like permease